MAIKSINAQGGDIILINNEVLDDKTLSIINQKIDNLSTELTSSIDDITNLSNRVITNTQNINTTTELINNLNNAKLISAETIISTNTDKRYKLSAKLDVNDIKLGDTTNNDRYISLSTNGDLFIRNQSNNKNIVLETVGNNSSIQSKSNIVLQNDKVIQYTNDLPTLINDNTLVTAKYINTKLDTKSTINVNDLNIATLNINTITQSEFENISQNNNDLYLVEDISIDANNQRIINVAEPIDSTDAATKQYADNNIGLLNNKTYLTLANSDLEQVSNILDPNITLSTIISNSTNYDNVNIKYIRTSINQLINKSIVDKNIVLKQFAFVNRVDATNIDTETTVQLVVCYWNTSLNGWRPTAYSNQFNLNTIDYYVYNLTLTHTIEKPTINSTEQLLICVLPVEQLNSFISTNNILNNTNIQIGIRVNKEYGISLFGPQNSLPNLTSTPSLNIVVPIIQFYYDYKISSYAELRDLLLTDLANVNL